MQFRLESSRCYTYAYSPSYFISPLPRHIIIHLIVHAQLLPQDISQASSVTQIHPVTASTPLLRVLALGHDHPVEALGARQRRAEPDLLVGGLLVEHVAELLGDVVDAEDAGLPMLSVYNFPLVVGDYVPSTRPRCQGSSLLAPRDVQRARSGTHPRARGTRWSKCPSARWGPRAPRSPWAAGSPRQG
jgi:hypothetical protein